MREEMDKKRIVREETYGEGINLVFGEGIGIVVTHNKHGDLDRERNLCNKTEERKVRRKWIRDSMRRKMRMDTKNEGMKIFVGSQENRNEWFLFALRSRLFEEDRRETSWRDTNKIM